MKNDEDNIASGTSMTSKFFFQLLVRHLKFFVVGINYFILKLFRWYRIAQCLLFLIGA